MQYFGGKARIARPIVSYLEQERRGRPYIEPFLGGASVFVRMSGERYGYDLCKPLITLYSAIRAGWQPPSDVTRELYDRYRLNPDADDPLTAFIGFGCSYNGRWFEGFVRSSTKVHSYAMQSVVGLDRKRGGLKDAVIEHRDYRELNPTDSLIYADPPYRGCHTYDAVGKFDHDAFWDKMRAWSNDNTVLISEFEAPPDFESVLEIRHVLHARRGETKIYKIDRLFRYAG